MDKKNIIILTPYYPTPYNKRLDTQPRVVHYLCKEWNNETVNLLILHLYPHSIKYSFNIINIIKSLFNKKKYVFENINVRYKDNFRFTPGKFNLSIFQKINNYLFLKKSLKDWGESPDFVVTHFPSSHEFEISTIKKFFNIPAIGVFHNIDLDILKKKKVYEQKRNVEMYSSIGFRSLNIKKDFEKIIDESTIPKKKFIVNSGIDFNLIKRYKVKNNVHIKILFVGRLDKNKNVISIIKALDELSQSNFNFEFNIIGEGTERNRLEHEVNKLNLSEQIFFLGQLSREEVFAYMEKSDLFVMVSHKETLGMVYLEAMAKGCIVIGSKGTGIDGIIIDNVNGFLVESHDSNKLKNTFIKIIEMSIESRNEILDHSFDTIEKLTEKKVSIDYYTNIINSEN